jgi:uncharacterized protein with ATP-grasp and redox domains
MKTRLDCYSCFLRQALQASRMALATPQQQSDIINAVMASLLREEPDGSPVVFVRQIQEIVTRITGVADPYRAVKDLSNQQAARWIDAHGGLVPDSAPEALEHAVRIAIAGNIIDYGPSASFDMEASLQKCLNQPFARSDLTLLRERLKGARQLAYLADNAGEIVFDRLLIAELAEQSSLERILLVVRDGPFLNDALEEDARAVGMDAINNLEILRMGPGVPARGSPGRKVWDQVEKCDVRIAKGQANAEAINTVPGFFLLFLVKCELVAREFSNPHALSPEVGDMMLVYTGD